MPTYKTTGWSLQELADLYGKRGCCTKGTCIHKKAKYAVDRIKELEDKIEKVKSAINLVKSWTEDETLGIYPSQMYLACIKDIRRHIS